MYTSGVNFFRACRPPLCGTHLFFWRVSERSAGPVRALPPGSQVPAGSVETLGGVIYNVGV